ncbi:MAG: bifunctional diaminohydroxyphosphoribosylaminopyrimidine deaminase/5-amino-6-(5-phosphoribosylamino)uracil reductase RibD [Solirubrobacterales bacterium]
MKPVKPGDQPHLDRAMQLALNGRGQVSPNPIVGAVVVKDDQVIGEGWHREYGGPHAERLAIEDAESSGNDVTGSTVYVSLEPCGHHGQQPPCAELLRDRGVAEVVVGCDDNSEKTAGVGPALLGDAGIEVRFATDAQAAQARSLVQDFRKFSATGRPLITLKMATSLDDRVAGPGGEPIHLSSPETDLLVHEWRAASDGVAVGAGTVRADDPRLTARGVDAAKQPRRILFGGSDSIEPESAVLEDLGEAPVLLITRPGELAGSPPDPTGLGVEVIEVEGVDGPSRFGSALDALGERGIRSILLEGGPRLAGSALEAGCVDRLEVFVAPRLLGEGPSMVELGQAIDLQEISVSRSGADVRLSSVLREW